MPARQELLNQEPKMPVWEKGHIQKSLPMYDSRSLYLDRLVFIDKDNGFGYLTVTDEHTKKHFAPDEFSIDRIVFPGSFFEAYLKVTNEHMQGHFTPQTNALVLPGHKQIAALIQAYEQGFAGKLTPNEYLKFMGVYNVKFMQFVLPNDIIKISVKDSYAGFWNSFLGDGKIAVGETQVSEMSNIHFSIEKGEEPKIITPDRLIEAAAQTIGCLYLNQKSPDNVIPIFQGFEIAEFEDVEITPGQTVEIEAKLSEQRIYGFTGDANIWLNGQKAGIISGITCGLADKNRMIGLLNMFKKRKERKI